MTKKQNSEQNRADTIALLVSFGVHFTEPNPNHLKVNNINYWPSSGKVFIDGANACLPDRGVHALEALLGQRGYRRRDLNSRMNTQQPPHSKMPSLSVDLDESDVGED